MHRLIELALAAAVGCLSAYGVLYLHRRGAVCRRRHPNAARVRRWCLVVGADPGTHVPIDFARKDARATVDVTLLPVPAQQAAR